MNPAIVEAIRDLDPNGRCVVALGGGADSAVLLAGAVEAFGHDRVVGVFVNHGLEVSPDLMETAKALCAQLSVPIHTEEALVEDGPDLESRARRVRYEALESVLGGSDICCTGHTKDDQAETVLMRLLRGSGPTGLTGIPASRGRFRRPLLAFTRAELRDIAVRDGLPFTDDPANSDPRFLRSRIRADLLPLMEAEYGDSVRDNLVRSSELVADDAVVLDELARSIPIRFSDNEVALPTAALVTQTPAVASRAIRTALARAHAPYRGGFDDVAAVMATVRDGTPRTLSSGVECLWEGPEVVLVLKKATEAPSALVVRTGDHFEWGGRRYRVSTTDRPSLKTTTPARTAIRVEKEGRIGVRGVNDGDRIDIDNGTTPVSEVLRSAGVPARNRPCSMVITVGPRIAAVHGVKVAPWARPVGGQPAVIIEWEGRT